MKIAIGNDHAGYELKQLIIAELTKLGYSFEDYGAFSSSPVDYPDIVHPLARDVAAGKYSLGVLICGSGNGVSITANKHQNIRAALCWNEEIARLARMHNDANIIALPARFITPAQGVALVRLFLETGFEGGRHEARVEKISRLT